jgi:glycolate oxidase
MADVDALVAEVVPRDRVVAGDAAGDDYAHDEALGGVAQAPACVVFPISTAEVASVLRVADEHGIPVTARGSGTGLSGAAIPVPGGIVVSFERMAAVVEIDTENQVAVVQPGVTLAQLDAITAEHGLVYPVYPGEYSASLGGNVATNAGGMRAVKYGVTRHQVLGLEAVLPSGDVIRTGGKFVKGSTGYDLTQLIIGSEGTLALVTEAILKLYPRPEHQATVLAPFRTLDDVMGAVPRIVASGIGPLIVEYIDAVTLAAMARHVGLDLGVPDDVREAAFAYLVVMLEDRVEARLDDDVAWLAEQLGDLNAIDVYVLPAGAAAKLIEAREKAFWIAKAANADDIVDVVVPRAAIATFMAEVGALAQQRGALVAGCGHAGDGNVHLSVYQPDAAPRAELMRELFTIGMRLGGVISGEHGIGTTKKKYFLALEDPVKIALMRRIKAAFDPNGILNPSVLFD